MKHPDNKIFSKPLVAYQKDEDKEFGKYSFTDHEERSYQLIKNWFFVSEYTKRIVRYHYLIRDIEKSKKKLKYGIHYRVNYKKI